MTILNLNQNASSELVQVGASIERINFYATPNSGVRGIFAPNVNRWTIRDCGFKNLSIAVEADSLANTVAGGDCSWWEMQNNTFIACATGIKLTSGSGVILGGDVTDCGIGIDINGTSSPVRVYGLKGDIGATASSIGIRARTYNCMFTNCYFEITTSGAIGIAISQDSAVSYSGHDNSIMACGFYGRASGAIGITIASGCYRTRIIAPVLSLNSGNTIQDSGTNTMTLAAG